jgi:membrane protease YdiL (CAAX protease family)
VTANLLAHLLFLLILVLPLQAVKGMEQLNRLVTIKPAARLEFYRSAIIGQWLIVLLIAFALAGRGPPHVTLGLVWPSWTPENLAISAIAALLSLAQSPIVPQVRAKLAASGRTRSALHPIRNLLPRTAREKQRWIGVSITAGICEEIIFRGFLFFYLQHIVGTSLYGAIVLSTGIFGLSHYYQGTSNVVRTSIIGLLLGIAYAATGSLLVPIMLHTALDLGGLYMDQLVDADTPTEN